MDIRIRIGGFFKRSVLEFIGALLNTTIAMDRVDVYVRVKFRGGCDDDVK